MSKTVDELCDVFGQASGAEYERWLYDQRNDHVTLAAGPALAMRRAGIAAVVRELMEHFVTGASTYAWDADDLHAEFMKILGDAGAEKVAGGSTREDEKAVEAAGDKGPVTVNSPATDPAPAVCVWTKRGDNEPGFYSTPHGLGHINHLPKSGGCWCGKPIKFMEAK